MSHIIPGRDPQEWAAFNTRFRLLIDPIFTFLCFLTVWGGSVYGIYMMLKGQFPQIGLIAAAGVALAFQLLNRVSVHFTTRMLAAIFTRKFITLNINQKFSGPDIFAGIFGLLITLGICVVDYTANKEGSEAVAEVVTERPAEIRVDRGDHEAVLAAARSSVEAQQAAERAERSAHDAAVDSRINKRKRELQARQRQISGKSWATSELKQIAAALNGLEISRRDDKAAFMPQKSDLAGAQAKFASISAKSSEALQFRSAQADTTNATNYSNYQDRFHRRKNGMIIFYLVGLFLWHLAEGFKAFRGLRYDEMHPEGGSAILAIWITIFDGISNAMWRLRARIYEMMPEDEIRGLTSDKAIKQASAGINRDVYSFILSHQGCNEMAIYLAFQTRDIGEVRNALRVLKTAKLVFESSGMWRADTSQAHNILGPDYDPFT